jgi:hypothetical protein
MNVQPPIVGDEEDPISPPGHAAFSKCQRDRHLSYRRLP